MPFHQKVDTEARLTRMIEDMGITLHPEMPIKKKDEAQKHDKEEKKDQK
ncbi:hypothetical protein [Sporolactobacillus vineae]|nr:hypothetical protein [Sporolactobacillus vineae]